jgi:hypothetical protein
MRFPGDLLRMIACPQGGEDTGDEYQQGNAHGHDCSFQRTKSANIRTFSFAKQRVEKLGLASASNQILLD